MEELKLILETVSELGGEAKWLFIIYLMKGFLSSVMGYGCLIFALFTIGKMLKNLFDGISLVHAIKLKMSFTTGETLMSHEKRQILATIDKGLAK